MPKLVIFFKKNSIGFFLNNDIFWHFFNVKFLAISLHSTGNFPEDQVAIPDVRCLFLFFKSLGSAYHKDHVISVFICANKIPWESYSAFFKYNEKWKIKGIPHFPYKYITSLLYTLSTNPTVSQIVKPYIYMLCILSKTISIEVKVLQLWTTSTLYHKSVTHIVKTRQWLYIYIHLMLHWC